MFPTRGLLGIMSMKNPRIGDRAARLKIARVSAKFQTPKAAAMHFGWSYSSYHNHETGLRDFDKSAGKYAEAFGVSEAWLLTGEGQGPMGLTNSTGARKRSDRRQEHKALPAADEPSNLVMVPVYDVRAAAGPGALNEVENQIGTWPFERSFLAAEMQVRSNELAVIEVVGDSMEPKLQSGDRVIVDLRDLNIATPGIFLIHDGTGLVVKRVERVFNTDPIKLRLISDNQFHTAYDVLASEVRILGRVRLKVGRL